MFPPVHEYEGDTEHDKSENSGERESRKQVTGDEGKRVGASHKQACSDRML